MYEETWVQLRVFYILLTVHLGIILDLTHFFTLFYVCLFHFSTCFEQPSAHHQENQLCQYIIWYISLCVGDCWYVGQKLPSDLHTR